MKTAAMLYHFSKEEKTMYTVYMKNNSTIYKSGFASYSAAKKYGQQYFGPGNFEIEKENFF